MNAIQTRTLALSLLLGTVGGLSALGACKKAQTSLVEQDYPNGQFSTTLVDFGAGTLGERSERIVWFQNIGDMTMGISSVTLGTTDKSDFFSVRYSQVEVSCPETEEVEEKAARGKRFVSDSAGGDDTGDWHSRPSSDLALELGPGCRVPLHLGFTPEVMGVVYGSLILQTKSEQVGENKDPSYYADPVHTTRMLYLKGEGLRSGANIVVSPRNYNFGHLWTGESENVFVVIRNTGASELVLNDVSLSASCGADFELVDPEGTQMVLGSGEATFAEVQFTALNRSSTSCSLVVSSEDEDTPEIAIRFEANSGTDPRNVAPSVAIRQPVSGTQWISRSPITMELNVFDVNQPTTSLECRVRSMALKKTTLASCTPTDASGHVFVTLDPADIGPGVDTIRVQVTDTSGVTTATSLTWLINAPFPVGDDDGDGWDEVPNEDGLFDCDDAHASAYPYGTEIADRIDNDCDGTIDEGTEFYDDDLDGYTEEDGDCDDTDERVYPGAGEIPDGKDNDCDGTFDEGTSLYDDDGDGYTEVDNDCNDNDPTVNPEAVEYCDGIDNDCNLLKDHQDGCIEIDSPPYVVGGVNLQQTACEEGDRIIGTLLAYDPDGQTIEYSWSTDTAGLVIDPLTGSPTVTITCPTLASNASTQRYTVLVVAADASRNSVWTQTDLYVYPRGELYKTLKLGAVSEEKSCSAMGGAPALALAGLAFSLSMLRRRRDD
jgi:hypothetical protein